MTKIVYEEIKNDLSTMIKRTNVDGSTSWIPTEPGNSDYQRYLRWLEDPTAEEGGTLS